MKKAVMSFIGAMMILSLAACTPTTEKNKAKEAQQTTEAVAKNEEKAEKKEKKEKEAKEPKEKKDLSHLSNSVDYEKGNDSEAPEESIVMVYTVDGKDLEGVMESVQSDVMAAEGPQAMVDLLVQYGVLAEGTAVVSYQEEGEAETAGPAGPGAGDASVSANAVLNLSQIPDDGKNELILHAVARTFLESMNVETITIQLNGQTVAENLTELDV